MAGYGGTRAQREHRQRVRQVIETYAGSRSLAWMARELGLSERTVQNWIWRLGWRKTDWHGWYTTGQAARVLGCSTQYVNRLCRQGRIRARRPPRSLRHRHYSWWLVCPEEVERLCRERNPDLWRRRGGTWR